MLEKVGLVIAINSPKWIVYDKWIPYTSQIQSSNTGDKPPKATDLILRLVYFLLLENIL